MSRRTELWWVLLLAGAVTVAAIAGLRHGTPPPDVDYRTSAFLSGPRGSKALYEVLARLRFPVERRRAPLFELTRATARRPAVLLVLGPVIPLLPAELAQVARFAHTGGSVVAAAGGGGIARCAGWRPRHAPSPFLDDTIGVLPPRPGLGLPPVANVLEPVVAAEQQSNVDECRLLVPSARDTLLAARDGSPVALRLRYAGGGSIVLWADQGYFRNSAWREGSVPYFVAPLLTPAQPGLIVWDEYHQGFGEEVSLAATTLDWLVSTPGGWALLQLIGVLLVALAVAAVRFGPARPAVERRRRSPLEHLEALAAGLEGAAGVDTALQLTVAGLRRRLSRTGRERTPPGGERQWLAALELALPTPRGRAAVRRLERSVSEPGGVERVLAAAQAVEDVWEELRPRTTRDAS